MSLRPIVHGTPLTDRRSRYGSASPNTCLQGLVLKASSCDGSLRGVKQRVEYPDLRGIYRGEFFEALRLALLVLGTP